MFVALHSLVIRFTPFCSEAFNIILSIFFFYDNFSLDIVFVVPFFLLFGSSFNCSFILCKTILNRHFYPFIFFLVFIVFFCTSFLQICLTLFFCSFIYTLLIGLFSAFVALIFFLYVSIFDVF